MQRAAFSIDDKPLRIRDALAHGRLVAPTKEYPLTLWKFGREVSGRIPIEFNEVLTSDWLEKAWKMINQQKDRVDACSKQRGSPITSRRLRMTTDQRSPPLPPGRPSTARGLGRNARRALAGRNFAVTCEGWICGSPSSMPSSK
jgi:hypothetical protein